MVDENGMMANKLIKKKLDKKTVEITDVIHDIEKKFVKLDDDYANISRHLFNMSIDCEKDLLRMDAELDKVQEQIHIYLDSAVTARENKI